MFIDDVLRKVYYIVTIFMKLDIRSIARCPI